MKIRRDIASVPVRSAAETWKAIVDLVTGSDTVDKQQLLDAASVMESLIADEMPANVPIVFKGGSSRVVFYCHFNEDAMELGTAIDKLNSNPTAGDWQVTAPCEKADVAWMTKSLKSKSPRISVHDVNEAPGDGDADKSSGGIEIDWGALIAS
jgi:hypothetical protein